VSTCTASLMFFLRGHITLSDSGPVMEVDLLQTSDVVANDARICQAVASTTSMIGMLFAV
jgi:hypothetical protein